MKNLNLLIAFVFYSFYSLSQQCPVVPPNQAGPDRVICPGGSTTIGTTTGPPSFSYSWFPTTGLSNPAIRNPIANPTTTTTYTLTVSPTTPNMIPNGNFELAALFTDYGILPTGDGTCNPANPHGGVAFSTNPQTNNPGWCNMPDHTAVGTRMLVADGSCNNTRRVWFRNNIPVTPNTTYNFSGWATSLFNNNPTLVIRINNVVLTAFVVPRTCPGWNFFTVAWQSGASNAASIDIRDNTIITFGNDFALDDLTFQPCPTVTDQVVVTVTSSAPVVSPAGPITYYNQHESFTNVVLTSTAAANYQWYKNSIAIPGATSQTYAIQRTGLGNWTDNYNVVTPCGTSNIVAFIYKGCNQDSQYPAGSLPLPPNPLCQSGTYPITLTAPSLGANASYQWWAANTPTCFSFSPSQSTTNTTQFNVNFPSCTSTDGIYTLSSKGQERIYMFYVRPVGCIRPAKSSETDSLQNLDTIYRQPILSPSRQQLDFDSKLLKTGKSRLIPNPGKGQVLLNSPSQIVSVQIYNLSGVLVKTIKGNNLKSFSIDIGGLRSGYYNCSILTSKGKETLKLLVQQ